MRLCGDPARGGPGDRGLGREGGQGLAGGGGDVPAFPPRGDTSPPVSPLGCVTRTVPPVSVPRSLRASDTEAEGTSRVISSLQMFLSSRGHGRRHGGSRTGRRARREGGVPWVTRGSRPPGTETSSGNGNSSVTPEWKRKTERGVSGRGGNGRSGRVTRPEFATRRPVTHGSLLPATPLRPQFPLL